ncbi:sugar transferase [Defluviimonas sp. WL0002]|uniref:Sugar transferase n=1 Tax=Albidovulum marisflavi TaxID=2984159 RepID=A0ABT2ZG87_9RHOB|nr:sugar transferase [Defluviimonas sp. WL0002]MCV2870149.1 sugar transferase [Defluviimonas sp. WL0002]
MTPGKRLFDLVLALVLLPLLLPAIAVVAVLVLIVDGRPVFYLGERMRDTRRAFRLVKFRTMRGTAEGEVATGGHTQARVTCLGRALRRYRLDELPQILHVFSGKMSFVGPRPPLRRYVELHPDLYEKALRCRPGVTGLATLRFHRKETRVMAACRSAGESDAVYRRLCLPRKARLDAFYARKRSLGLDLAIIAGTLAAVFLNRDRSV